MNYSVSMYTFERIIYLPTVDWDRLVCPVISLEQHIMYN